MDIQSVEPAVTLHHPCDEVACGQCGPCHRRAMLMTADYVVRKAKKDAPEGVLLDLLKCLGLPG